MQRRSQGSPSHSPDLEIERTLSQIRRLNREESRGLGDIIECDLDTSSTSSHSDIMDGDYILFREFGNPEDYELTGGILLPVTETYFYHPLPIH